MKHIILTSVLAILLFACGQSDTKQKELELKERELALKEKELQNKEAALNSDKTTKDTIEKKASIDKIIENKCDSKFQLSGKLIKVVYDGSPCPYAYLKIEADDGKQYDIYLGGNLSNFNVDNKKLFKWTNEKITNLIENTGDARVQFPNDAIDLTLLNKTYLFCCYKDDLGCGDDPNSPKEYFCKKILTQ